jgi:Flp pilus assembly pilin Flp
MIMKMKEQKGQGLAEYIIIAALVAIAAIGVVSLFGDNVRALFATSSNALAGAEEAEAKTCKANCELCEHKNLKNFAKDNKPDCQGC